MDLKHLSVLYRGPLESCTYACPYCPFAKHHETPAEHRADGEALERFLRWVEAQPFTVSVLFTPWGEALAHARYQQAIVRLGRLPNVRQVAIQTNLSGRLDWTRDANLDKTGLWCTYHPGETSAERFLKRCAELDARGVRYSVGTVGLKRHLPEIEAMRAALPAHIYLWVNAYRPEERRATPEDVARLVAVDPLFKVNRRYRVRGQPCTAGEDAVSVEGDGTVRRCHFIERPLGNLYEQDVRTLLRPRPCSRAACDCHIGYAHVPALGLPDVFRDGLLARIPDPAAWTDPAALHALLERARAHP